MKKNLLQFIFVLLVLAISAVASAENVDAFPGAEGGGRYTTGGRGGKVIHVTNLNDSGTGSLRQALCKTSGARIIVFDVSGTIELQSALKITYGDVTVAGQTAPGDGICIKNYTTSVQADNVIIRFIRFRMGDEMETEDDAIWGRNQSNIILDHCSMSWSTDECSSFYNNTNFTMQWCILGESLRISVHEKGTHGYGGIWGGKYATFHHNFVLHHDSRNPRMCGPRFRTDGDVSAELVDMRNCVFYNWGSNSGYAGEGGRYNFVNNYYKPGPASKVTRIFQPYAYKCGSETQYIPNGSIGLFYVDGNYMNGKGESYDFSGFSLNSNSQTTFYQTLQDGSTQETTTMSESTMRTTTMFEYDCMADVTTQTAAEAYELVLGYAGASLVRDAVDARYAREAREGTYTYAGTNGSSNGLIDTQTDCGGFPTYASTTAPTDTDGDGMPDDWETANGLDPNTDDSAKYTLDSSYTNIEVYINSLVQDIMDCKAVVNTDETYGYDEIETRSSQTWDFTAWSTETIDNVVADIENSVGGWTYNSDSSTARYKNSEAISGTATANGVTISELDGLVFSASSGKLIINNNAEPTSLQMGDKGAFSITECPAGAKITIDFKSANTSTAREWTLGNVTADDATTTTIDRTTMTYTVTATGTATFTSSGLVLYSITLDTSSASTSTDSNAIKSAKSSAAEVVSRTYYAIDGRQHAEAVRGVNIVIETLSDGTRQSRKIIVK